MAEIVLEVVAIGLEYIEGLVLDLPAGAAAGGEFGDSLGGDRQSLPRRRPGSVTKLLK
jgi:hypothetical protein